MQQIYSKHPQKEEPSANTDKVVFIEAQLISGREPGLTQAFALLQRAADIDTQAKDRLSPHLCKYLEETNKTSHIVAALNCLYVFEDMKPFKELVLHLGKSGHRKVRFAVASHLANFGIWDPHKEERFGDEAIITLAITLTRDNSPSVRDWAVFQFNNGLANDSAAIRRALRERVNDAHLAVRQEAVAALIARGETEYYPLIKQKLSRIDVAPVWIDTAAVSGNATFIPSLESLLIKRQQSKSYQDDGSTESIKEAISTLSLSSTTEVEQ